MLTAEQRAAADTRSNVAASRRGTEHGFASQRASSHQAWRDSNPQPLLSQKSALSFELQGRGAKNTLHLLSRNRLRNFTDGGP